MGLKAPSRVRIPLSPPDTEKPASCGFFRIWRRERDENPGSNRAQRAHETGLQAGEPEGPATEGCAVIPLSPPDTTSPAKAGFFVCAQRYPRIARNTKKKTMDSNAPASTVTNQDTKMVPTTRRLMAVMPRTSPTPSTAPTSVWVVEMGSPVPDAITMVAAAAIPAQKPRLGVRCVILLPTV